MADDLVPVCGICGEPMPAGEQMFKYHGYSGPCPKPPLPKKADDLVVREWTEDEKYYVPVPYWEMYNVVARAYLAMTAERNEALAFCREETAAFREASRVIEETRLQLTASEAARGRARSDMAIELRKWMLSGHTNFPHREWTYPEIVEHLTALALAEPGKAGEAARVTGDGLFARLMASEAVLRVAAEEVDVMLDNARHRLRQALAEPVKEPSETAGEKGR